MGYLISQIYLCLAIAAVIGGLIGYLLKQFEERKSAEALETTWSEKVRRASRELDTLRGDLKMQAQRYEDLERESEADQARLLSAKNELATERERVSGLTASLSEKGATVASLESSAAEMQSTAARIVELESSLHSKDQTIQSLEEQLAEVKNEIASLTTKNAELQPLTGTLDAAKKSLSEADARYAAFAAAKKSETSALKNRIADLEPLTAKLRDWELRYNDMLKEKDSGFARLTANVAALEPLRGRVDAILKENQALKDSLQQASARIKDAEERDDLKKIAGVSRAVEKRLNEYGVQRFKQIALWTKEDVDNFEKQLPEFRGRVERDQWIARAKEQHLKKYGETL
ncbi:MAG TPA: hypothetical protein VGL53_10065 [Bryobacteraceae bacterium]|jgi:predicted flap endonuclease-1-like 5' DNA nuclease/uncharacterized coiled-coil protein SlyX